MITQEQIDIIKGKCPKCGAELIYTRGNPDFYRCPNYPKCNDRAHAVKTVVWLAQHYIEYLERQQSK